MLTHQVVNSKYDFYDCVEQKNLGFIFKMFLSKWNIFRKAIQSCKSNNTHSKKIVTILKIFQIKRNIKKVHWGRASLFHIVGVLFNCDITTQQQCLVTRSINYWFRCR
jgi:hypothetical protein